MPEEEVPPGRRVVECIRDLGPISRVDVARRTGLAPATVNRWVARMMRSGLVRDVGADLGTGGRPSVLVELDERHGVVLAVDVADRHIDLAHLDLTGSAISTERVPTPGPKGQDRLQVVIDHIAAAAAAEDGPPVLTIGVSVPGPVHHDGTVQFAPSLDWHDVPLGHLLEEATGLSVVVENDANLIALAEFARGPWEDVQTLVTIAVFDGVGMGIVEGGRVWRGATGAAGQIGRMLFSPDALGTTFGGFGDLELHLGRVGIASRASALGLVTGNDPRDADVVLERAAAREPGTRALLGELLDDYAFALVNVCALLEPDVVVLSGLFDRWGDLVIPLLASRMEGQVVTMPRLERPSIGPTGALVGAGLRAFQESGGLGSLITG
ncbi:ROK family protein [Georgenia sp. Z1344]|uniref:ROK family protein n=1 Tax=Georgenia sp. Z1344 TaxID=3416706 RepID=UPI003CF17BEF